MVGTSYQFRPSSCYLLSFVIVVLDQVTKLMVEQFMRLGESIPLIESFNLLRLTFITNTGAAWGILRGYNVLLVTVAFLVSLGCVWVIQTAIRPTVRLSATLILGGGIGNMLDRLFLSTGVVDFVDVGIYHVRWPAFNVADTVLSLGMLVFLWSIFREEMPFLNYEETGQSSNHG